MSLRSFRRPSLLLGVVVPLGLFASHCTTEPAGEETLGEAEAALTTPTGAELVVLPRPAARTSTIYKDAFAAPFGDASSGATVTTSTTTKSEGTSSLSITLTNASSSWAAAIAAGNRTYAGAGQTELSFAFNAGTSVSAGLDALAVGLDDDDAATTPTWVTLKPYLVTSGNIAANTWYKVTIPTSALNPSGRAIRKVVLANKSGLANVRFFLDDVRLSWTDPSPTERVVYADAAGTDFTIGGWSVTSAQDTYRTTGAQARRASFTAAWGAFTFVYDWNKAAFPAGTFTTVSFDVSAGTGTPPAAMNSLRIGLDTAPTKVLVNYVPGGFKANTWHRVTIPCSELVTGAYRYVTFKNETSTLFPFYVDNVRFQTDHAPPALESTDTPPVGGDPDTFAAGEVDVVSIIRTAENRKAISPLIYGINGFANDSLPADVLASVTLVRRGGDRGNSYNWETNVSNGSHNNGFVNDMNLASGVANPNAPAAQDLTLLASHRPAGRAVMVPFVLQDWVSGPAGNIGAYDQAGWNRAQYFRRVGFTKPTAYSATPDLNDGMVYPDEHLDYMMKKYPGVDITAPTTPGQLLVGIDNEPDLYHYNFPMLQSGTGEPILASNGRQIGTRVTGAEFTQRVVQFARRVKQIAPQSHIVGPSHYHFDGWTMWHQLTSPVWSTNGRWYMDDFLADMKAASETSGVRLLDTWDFHWYPQGMSNGTYVWNLDHAARALTQAEIDQIVQGPRSYWDTTYNENSWITSNLGGPAYVINRLLPRIATGYPGTNLGVSEYFTGGRNHVSSAVATADTLGVFARMGVKLAAMWPVGSVSSRSFAYGALKLMRNANGAGLRYAETDVKVEHPEIVPSSVYAASDTADRVTVLVVNKSNATRRFGLRAFNTQRLTQVDAYRVDSTHATPFLASSEAVTKNNAYAYSAPAMSATMLVFRKP